MSEPKIELRHLISFDQADPMIRVHHWYLTVVLPDGKPTEEIIEAMKERLHDLADSLTPQRFRQKK